MKNYLHVGPSFTVGQGADYKNIKNGLKNMLAHYLARLWYIVVFFDPINMRLDTIFLVIFDTVKKLWMNLQFSVMATL